MGLLCQATTMINDMVEDVKASVTVECVIPSKHHRSVIGRGGVLHLLFNSCFVCNYTAK